jgi:neuronal PAS domain-containing protein 1/3
LADRRPWGLFPAPQKIKNWGGGTQRGDCRLRTDTALQNPPLPEGDPPADGKQAAPEDKDEVTQTCSKRIKVEPGPRERRGSADSVDEEPPEQQAPPRLEFTSVIRAGALKQDPVRPWGLVPGDPPPALLHAGFLPPVMRGLCTPGTIRYGPTELGLMYPHLQRLGPGPSLPEAFYPTLGLPYPGPVGTRVQRKGV